MATGEKVAKKRAPSSTAANTKVVGGPKPIVKAQASKALGNTVKDTSAKGASKSATENTAIPGLQKPGIKTTSVAVNGKHEPLANGKGEAATGKSSQVNGKTPSNQPKAAKKSGLKAVTKDTGKQIPRIQATEQENQREATNDDFPMPVVETVKPPNQLQLSEKELSEEHGRVLNAARPGPARVILRYNLEERAYKPEPQLEQVLVHFSSEGNLLHREGEEGQALVKSHTAEDERLANARDQGDAATDATSNGKRLRNQFNFSERGIQTTFYPPRERGTNTEVPEIAEASGTCSQWEIYDAYVADQLMQKQQQEEANKQKGGSSRVAIIDELGATEVQKNTTTAGPLQSESMQKALAMVERMSTQNNFEDIILDFKYWEDEADIVKLEEGTLLPLWNFSCSVTNQKQVTAVNWSSTYPDLFVAAFGSFDFQKQSSGYVAGFSLKNTAHPEFYVRTKSGVMAIHMSLHNPNLLVVGCYDGSVAVYDVRNRHDAKPIFSSTPKSGSHSRPVWAVEWLSDQSGAAHAFHSLSSDGRLLHWTLGTAELTSQELLQMTQQGSAINLLDKEPSQPVLAAACCMDFHPEQDFMVLIGTEEGAVYKCNTAHRAGYLLAYEGHAMAVYSVQWNRVHTSTFLTSSADWTVKLWNENSPKAIMSFALGSPVGDIAWSLLSATIFAAVTEDGLTRVFDLHQNTTEPLCEQKVVAKAGLTRLAFNPKYPVLLVGDDRGHLATLKLSPNLRKIVKDDVPSTRIADERSRLDKVLEIARKRNQAIEKAAQSANVES